MTGLKDTRRHVPTASLQPLDRRRAVPPARWFVAAFFIAACVLMVSVFAGRYERNSATLSPYDEGAHYDYVTRLLDGDVPRWGTQLDQDTLLLDDCLSTQKTPGMCARRHRPETPIAGGYSYEAQQPPLGYVPYLLTANPNAPPRSALVDARWGGMIWAGVATVLIVGLAALESMSLLQLLAMLVICVLSPVAVYSEFTVTNDSAGVVAGVISLLAVRVGARRSVHAACAIGLTAGLAVGLLKGLFAFAPLAIVLAAVVDAAPWRASGATWRSPWGSCVLFAREHITALALLAGSVGALLGWELFQDVRGMVPPSVVLHALMGFAITPHIRMSTMLDSVEQQFFLFQMPLGSLPLYALWNIGIYGIVVAAALFDGASVSLSRVRSLAVGTIIAAVAVAAAWTVLTYLQGHFDMSAATRYSLPFLPLIAAIIVRANQRWILVWLGVLLPLAAVGVQLHTAGY